MEQEVFEGVLCRNERGEVLGFAGLPELHVDVANLIHGIIGDGAVRVAVEDALIGFCGLLNAVLTLISETQIEVGDGGIFTVGGVLNDRGEHFLGAVGAGQEGKAEEFHFFSGEVFIGNDNLTVHRAFEIRRVGILSDQFLV